MTAYHLGQILSAPSDINMVDQIREGNTVVFKSLFESYYKKLCYFAWRMLDDQSEAEDLVQDVFVRIWQNRQQLNISRSLSAYLYHSVKNACLNQIKHRKVKLEYAQYFTGATEEYSENTVTETGELKILIEIHIRNLPPERQKIFVMSRKQGLKHKEIADELGISVKTVENQIAKALKYFREVLQDYLPWYLVAIWLENVKHFF
jgi:RNA polymerase sigma-70 factor, ECF subfamily